MPQHIDKLTPEQEAKMAEWADRWIEIGLSTAPADRPQFEAAVAECYRHAGLQPPERIVWCPSPLVAVVAGPIAARLLDGAVGGAVGGAVRGAVRGAVYGAVGDAVDGAVDGAVRGAVCSAWARYIGGQFWVGGWYGHAYQSFFLDACGLDIGENLASRARAYGATAKSACWWWPHREFVMVSERPRVIRRELVDPARPRGWGSHRLHCEDGPAVAWGGWSIYAWHGVRVPEFVIERPETITAERVHAEPNQEVRRAMIERIGWDVYLFRTKAQPVQSDRYGDLYHLDVAGAPATVVLVTNSTPEPDGHYKRYGLMVPDNVRTAHEGVAATFGVTTEEYAPVIET
jgi:hypothetical protein